MAGLWYRVGTISVTNGSKKVTGFGTQFKTSTYKPDKGHTFWGPDGKHYEVDYVESDTVLYLVQAYTGPTVSGQSYEIDITRTSTIPALSREISAQLAYAQGQYDSWQQILTGSGNVTLTAPDGQSVIVPALSNMLSKSGNLAGLADKAAGRTNLGLGDSSTKDVGVSPGTVAAGDHFHNRDISIGGDANTFYPVLIEGRGLSLGVAIDRTIHQDYFFAGSLSFHMNGIGYGWGSNNPYLAYQFSQLWGNGNTSGCLADVMTSNALEGVYVWLRGGRTYRISSAGQIKPTIYLSGVTEDTGQQFMPKVSGPLSQRYSATTIGSAPLYHGPVNDNKPYWNGENFPVSKGVFYMTAPNCPGVQLMRNNCTFVRHGDLCRFNVEYVWGMAQGDAPTGRLLVLQGLPFISQDISPAVVECRTDQLRIGKQGGIKAMIDTGKAEIYFVIEEASGETTNILTDVIKPTTYGVYQSFNITGTYKVG